MKKKINSDFNLCFHLKTNHKKMIQMHDLPVYRIAHAWLCHELECCMFACKEHACDFYEILNFVLYVSLNKKHMLNNISE